MTRTLLSHGAVQLEFDPLVNLIIYYKDRKKVTNELKQQNEPSQAEGRGNQ